MDLFSKIAEWISCDQDVLHSVIGLDAGQIAFLKRHDIIISTQYIGMIRMYYQNRTIWQSSGALEAASALKSQMDLPMSYSESFRQAWEHHQALAALVRDYLDRLMLMSPDDRAQAMGVHVGLI